MARVKIRYPGIRCGDVITMENGVKSLVRDINDPDIQPGDTVLMPNGQTGHVVKISKSAGLGRTMVCDDEIAGVSPEEMRRRIARFQEERHRIDVLHYRLTQEQQRQQEQAT